MLSTPIQAASQAGTFDAIHVSTDSQDIAQVASKFGFLPEFMQPKDLSGNRISIMQCLKYVLKKIWCFRFFYSLRGYSCNCNWIARFEASRSELKCRLKFFSLY